MKLDVGCGTNPKGDVNLDYRTGLTFETTQNAKGQYLDAKKTKNFVKGDALHLPFKSSSFDIVYSSHVIEHVSNPYELLKEMIRVSNNIVEIRCPHRFSYYAKGKHHRNFINLTWLIKTIRIYAPNCKVISKLNYWYPIPFTALIQLPHEIFVTAHK